MFFRNFLHVDQFGAKIDLVTQNGNLSLPNGYCSWGEIDFDQFWCYNIFQSLRLVGRSVGIALKIAPFERARNFTSI